MRKFLFTSLPSGQNFIPSSLFIITEMQTPSTSRKNQMLSIFRPLAIEGAAEAVALEAFIGMEGAFEPSLSLFLLIMMIGTQLELL